jgi:hypothetical protein
MLQAIVEATAGSFSSDGWDDTRLLFAAIQRLRESCNRSTF